MKILLLPDSFKGSLSAQRAADILCAAANEVLPDAEVVKLPAADGGEGTLEAVKAAVGGAIAPKSPLRYVAIIIWLYSALRGLQLSWEHTMIQLHPSPFQTCDFAARFPTWLPLDKWLPQVFVATGDCSVRQWEFLTLEMPQWLVGIFAAYLVVGVLVLIAQPFKPKKRDLFGR